MPLRPSAASLAFAAALALAACATADPPADPAVHLLGASWTVEDLDGRGVVDSAAATLQFSADGRLTGRGSCNSYGGSYIASGETLSVGALATTKRACAEALMRQEQLFYDILGGARRFRFADDGALLIQDGAGRRILARR